MGPLGFPQLNFWVHSCLMYTVGPKFKSSLYCVNIAVVQLQITSILNGQFPVRS